jgi:hypothetical protein
MTCGAEMTERVEMLELVETAGMPMAAAAK